MAGGFGDTGNNRQRLPPQQLPAIGGLEAGFLYNLAGRGRFRRAPEAPMADESPVVRRHGGRGLEVRRYLIRGQGPVVDADLVDPASCEERVAVRPFADA